MERGRALTTLWTINHNTCYNNEHKLLFVCLVCWFGEGSPPNSIPVVHCKIISHTHTQHNVHLYQGPRVGLLGWGRGGGVGETSAGCPPLYVLNSAHLSSPDHHLYLEGLDSPPATPRLSVRGERTMSECQQTYARAMYNRE